MVNKGFLIGFLVTLLLASVVLAINIKDISIKPTSVEMGSSAEISVIVNSELKILNVEGFITYPDGSENPIKFETKDGGTFTSLFEKAEKEGGYGLNVVATDEKESTKAFTKFEVVPVPEPPTTMDIVKNDTNKIISILNISQNQMSEISANLSKIAKSTEKPVMYMHGTEYQFGQTAKLWLQLLNSSGEPINQGVCFLDIYTPNNQHYLYRATMSNMNQSGIYYYDLAVPDTEGVYPAIAECYYEVGQVRYYATSFVQQNFTTSNVTIANDDLECNGFSCNFGWNDGWQNLTEITTITTSGSPNGTYQIQGNNDFDMHRYIDATPYTQLFVSFSLGASSLEAGDICHVEYATDGYGGTFTDLVTITNGGDDIGSTTYVVEVTSYGLTENSGIGFYANTNENGDYCYLDDITFFGILGTPDVGSMELIDTNTTYFQESPLNGTSKLDIYLYLNDTDNCSLVSPSFLAGITIFSNAQFPSVVGDNLTISLWNYTSGEWYVLPNTIPVGTSFTSVSNSIALNNITESGFYNSTMGVMVRITDTNLPDTTNSLLRIDQFYMSCDEFVSPEWQEIRGSSEMHISSNITSTYVSLLWDYITNTIYPYLVQIWNKLLGIETQLNTTINITNQSLVLDTEINQTTHGIDQKLDAINQSMFDKFAEKDAHIQSAYDNLSSEINNFSTNTSQNFNLTWQMIQGLNITQSNDQILSYLANITLAINQTQTQLSAVNQSVIDNMNSINQSLSNQINISTNTTQTLITALNTSNQARFDQLQSLIDNLSIQVSQNQNITQQNISDLTSLILSLNLTLTTDISNLNTTLQNDFVALNATLAEMKSEISNTENMTIIINQSVEWIIQYLNISTNDLNLFVEAPNRCLVDTNWVARAQVKDHFGIILSPLDGVECNMTTDLWGTSNMSYTFLDQKYLYTHTCDPADTTFNWSVNCERVS